MNFETEYDQEFAERSMWDQLGKIIDSESARDVVPEHKFKPVTEVITDDGWVYEVSPIEAETIKQLVLAIKTKDRLEFLKMLQDSVGFEYILELVSTGNITKA